MFSTFYFRFSSVFRTPFLIGVAKLRTFIISPNFFLNFFRFFSERFAKYLKNFPVFFKRTAKIRGFIFTTNFFSLFFYFFLVGFSLTPASTSLRFLFKELPRFIFSVKRAAKISVLHLSPNNFCFYFLKCFEMPVPSAFQRAIFFTSHKRIAFAPLHTTRKFTCI